MKHRCLILLALVLALATSARAQVPELDPLSAALAEPALPSWEGDAGTLRIRYGSETLFEGAVQVRASEAEEFRAAKPGELVFTPAQTTGERTQQFWKIEAAPDSGLSELFLSGELRTSAEGLAAETRDAHPHVQARLRRAALPLRGPRPGDRALLPAALVPAAPQPAAVQALDLQGLQGLGRRLVLVVGLPRRDRRAEARRGRAGARGAAPARARPALAAARRRLPDRHGHARGLADLEHAEVPRGCGRRGRADQAERLPARRLGLLGLQRRGGGEAARRLV